ASSVPRRAGLLIDRILAVQPKPAEPLRELLHDLAAVVGARQEQAEVVGVLSTLRRQQGAGAVQVQLTVLGGLADGVGRRGKHLSALPHAHKALAAWADWAFGQAAGIAADPRRPADERLAAVRLLAHASWAAAGPVLTALVTAEPDQAVRLAAVGAIAAQPGEAPIEALLKPWRGYSPAVRREAVSVLVKSPDRALRLLHAIE